MKDRKWVYISLGALIVAGGYFTAFHKTDDRPLYRVDKFSRGDISLTITATDTFSADTTVQVGSQVSGRIAKLAADFNVNVREGQLLAQIDPTFLQNEVDQQKTVVENARADE